MKEMVYTKQRCPHGEEIILYNGVKDGYRFCILSYGTHPCAYVRVPEKHCCFGKDYMRLDIVCHGGLTYSRNYFPACKESENEWWIGWDYAHCNDYMGYYGGDENCLEHNSKKWSTEEIYSEVCNVIRQLKEMED